MCHSCFHSKYSTISVHSNQEYKISIHRFLALRINLHTHAILLTCISSHRKKSVTFPTHRASHVKFISKMCPFPILRSFESGCNPTLDKPVPSVNTGGLIFCENTPRIYTESGGLLYSTCSTRSK